MPWYAIRSIYDHGRHSGSTAVFSERVLLFQAADFDAAAELAEREAARYLTLNPQFQRLGDFTGFVVRERELPSEGAEVWCMLYEADLSGADFYTQRYKEFELPPGEDDAC